MDEDAYLEKVLHESSHKQEALLWIQQKDGKQRAIGDGEQDAAASLKLVKDLYESGATEVTAIDIEVDTYLETTSTLIVKLPRETTARGKVFLICGESAKSAGFDSPTDQGQRCLMLHW